jgi:hypothetical protein
VAWLANLQLRAYVRISGTHTLIQAFNARMRRMHLSPHYPGDWPLMDRAKATAMRAYGLRRHLPGRNRAMSA